MIDYEYIPESNQIRVDNSDTNHLSAVFNLKYETENEIYKGFDPIGNRDNKFDGEFNGSNYTISNLYINREEDFSGVFGNVSEQGTVKNIEYDNIDT